MCIQHLHWHSHSLFDNIFIVTILFFFCHVFHRKSYYYYTYVCVYYINNYYCALLLYWTIVNYYHIYLKRIERITLNSRIVGTRLSCIDITHSLSLTHITYVRVPAAHHTYTLFIARRPGSNKFPIENGLMTFFFISLLLINKYYHYDHMETMN